MTPPNPLWYVTRGTAFVSLVLLTLSVVGGVLTAVRWREEGWPRFVVQQLHRNVTLVAVAFIAVHVVTAVIDPFAKLKVTDAIIPFTASYRPLWLGMGVIAMELVAALTITSLVRGRLGFRAWRLVHWLAYVSWPVALVHGLGTGTDARTFWGLGLDVVCAGLVLMAILWRVSDGWPRAAMVRSGAVTVATMSTVVIAGWAMHGPLKTGWAKQAGTPAALLAAQGQATPSSGPSASAQPTPTPTPQPATLVAGLRDQLSGSATQDSQGTLHVSLDDRTNPSIHVAVTVDAGDQATLTVTRNGATVCDSAPAQVGRGVAGVCGGVLVRLELQQSDDGVFGEMTTRAAEQ